jgi:hypothetical protein
MSVEGSSIMLRGLLAILVVVLPIISSGQDQPAQDPAAVARSQVAAAIAAAGCGPSEFQFDVKGDNQQHPMPQAEPGKALIYIFENDTVGAGNTRIGLDSKWVGATQNGTYFFFAIDPGEHRLCVNVQTDKPAPAGTAGTISAEAGRTYYFETQAYGNQFGVSGVQLQQLDDANGQYMVATHSLSVTKTPPKPYKPNDDSIYNH